jgi:transcriptional regulator with XRE-family HTH domain
MRRNSVGNAKVAEVAGVHPNTVSKWLSDVSPPGAEALDRVARMLGVTSQWLRYGEAGVAGGAEAQPAAYGRSARVFLADFRAELTRAGVSDEEIEDYTRFLTSPERFAYNADGRAVTLSEADALLELRSLAEGIVKQQQRRGRRVILPKST